MHDIERELIDITGYKPARKFANRQDYLGSLLNAVLKLSNDDFDALSDAAALWANSAVESKNARSEELPDFDEADPDAGEESESDAGDSEEVAEESPSDPAEEQSDDPAVDEEPAPRTKKVAKASKPAKPSKPKKSTKVPVRKFEGEIGEPDVNMDKWGAIEGSKSSVALGMFEKGATTKEIKDAIGGTYYNILKRMVAKGHKVEKEGAVIKLTHSDEIGKKSKKETKK